jgi:hypothetical protein
MGLTGSSCTHVHTLFSFVESCGNSMQSHLWNECTAKRSQGKLHAGYWISRRRQLVQASGGCTGL